MKDILQQENNTQRYCYTPFTNLNISPLYEKSVRLTLLVGLSVQICCNIRRYLDS
jgi:hypothetical protein